MDTAILLGLASVILAGSVFSSLGYVLTISQTLVFAVELVHSLVAAALFGALIEAATGVVPMQLVIFLYSMSISSLVAELVRKNVPRDSVVAFTASLSAVVTIASLWGLIYVTPLGVSRALGALWGSILLVTPSDLTYLAIVVIAVVTVIVFFDLEFKYISFDPDLATASGLNVRAYYYLIYATTSISLSATVKIYGSVLASVLVVLPSITAQYVFKRVELPIYLVSGLTISTIGYLVSLMLNTQTSLCVGVISLAVVTLGVTLRWLYGR
ncbi:MAG: metal ABC transporter permease [Sulfolobales archaeon]|nr:metal ABC transporter permease [Sulfolobales archaeon]MDW8083543.1 metal ABC transporter permease [Sulfolobales archaeon]